MQSIQFRSQRMTVITKFVFVSCEELNSLPNGGCRRLGGAH